MAPRLPPLEQLRLTRVPGQRGARQILWDGQVLVSLILERAHDRPLQDLVDSFGGTARHLAWACRQGLPDRLDYAWVHDLRVPAAFRGLGLARHALAAAQAQADAPLVVCLGAASEGRMSPIVRREVYRRLGFALTRAQGMDVGVRLPESWRQDPVLTSPAAPESTPPWARPAR